LAAGGKRWRTMNSAAYVAQTRETSGFWMSFHEYLADYPWLTKRMAVLDGLASGIETQQPPRNPFACFLALFVPRLGVAAGGASGLVMVAIIGILAAVAIPAYQDYTIKAKMSDVILSSDMAKSAVTEYYGAHHAIPANLEEAGLPPGSFGKYVQDVKVMQNGAVVVTTAIPNLTGKSVIFVPSLDENQKLIWQCVTRDIPLKYLPPDCHNQ